jgi:hypothetical protein
MKAERTSLLRVVIKPTFQGSERIRLSSLCGTDNKGRITTTSLH